MLDLGSSFFNFRTKLDTTSRLCKKLCKILFNDVREPSQWTLERIDNSIGHTTDNVEICCYKCNIKRGTKNSEDFRFAKQMKIIKKE